MTKRKQKSSEKEHICGACEANQGKAFQTADPINTSVILQFNNPEYNPDAKAGLENALHGAEFRYAIDDFLQYLRSELKYAPLPEDIQKALEDMRTKLWEILKERDINQYF